MAHVIYTNFIIFIEKTILVSFMSLFIKKPSRGKIYYFTFYYTFKHNLIWSFKLYCFQAYKHTIILIVQYITVDKNIISWIVWIMWNLNIKILGILISKINKTLSFFLRIGVIFFFWIIWENITGITMIMMTIISLCSRTDDRKCVLSSGVIYDLFVEL